MKKILYLSFLFLGLFLTSCKNQKPQIHIENPLIITVGDSIVASVSDVNSASYSYSKSRNESKPVFSISNETGFSTTIYALNPGTDTLWISIRYRKGIYAYGELMPYEIRVTDKE